MPVVERHVTVNGISLWTASQGSGPPVVLCHGGPGAYDNLELVAAMIDDLAAVHRYDQRGCGRSQDSGPFNAATFVADLDALRAHWGYETWTVIGHSWGAELVLLYAIEHPRRISRLVYISGTGIDPAWHKEYRKNREAKLPANERERFRRLNARRHTASGAELACINRERAALLATTEYYDATKLDDLPRHDRFPFNYTLNAVMNDESKRMEEAGELPVQVRRITAPALILDGEADPRPRWARAHVARLLPDSRHVTVPRAGHEPWIEQPEATARALREFLAETHTDDEERIIGLN